MEWHVAENLVDELKKKGGFEILRKKLDQLCEEKGIYQDAKVAIKQMIKEEYGIMLKQAKKHPTLQLKMTNKRVLSEELSTTIEKRFPWTELRKDVVKTFLTSPSFRKELDNHIDDTLDMMTREEEPLEIGADSLQNLSARNLTYTSKKVEMETLLNELFGIYDPNNMPKVQEGLKLDISPPYMAENQSISDTSELEALAHEEELEEGELPSTFLSFPELSSTSEDKRQLLLGKLVVAKVSIFSETKWIYSKVIGINMNEVRVVSVPLIDGIHHEWAMKDWIVSIGDILPLPEVTDLNAMSKHLLKMKKAQSTKETIMALHVDITDSLAHIFQPARVIFLPEDSKSMDIMLTVEMIETHIRHLVPANQCLSLK
jgi:hypothetical protein